MQSMITYTPLLAAGHQRSLFPSAYTKQVTCSLNSRNPVNNITHTSLIKQTATGMLTVPRSLSLSLSLHSYFLSFLPFSDVRKLCTIYLFLYLLYFYNFIFYFILFQVGTVMALKVLQKILHSDAIEEPFFGSTKNQSNVF